MSPPSNIPKYRCPDTATASFLICSSQNVYGVAIGGTIGHAICTSIAVIGGRMLAQRISVRTGGCI